MPDNSSQYYPLTGLRFYLNAIPHHCLHLETKIIFVACDLLQADRARGVYSIQTMEQMHHQKIGGGEVLQELGGKCVNYPCTSPKFLQ